MKKLSQEVVDLIIASGGKALIDIGRISLNEPVDGTANGIGKVRITGALFQMWVTQEVFDRMAAYAPTADEREAFDIEREEEAMLCDDIDDYE